MNAEDLLKKRISIAEKRISTLIKCGDLKKLSETQRHQIYNFYKVKCLNRLESGKLIYNVSRKNNKKIFGVNESYNDFAEVVAAAYYSMYYIVHAFLALEYNTKLREGLRGVHAITEHAILYYLVKTKKLAKHLYEEYLNTFESAVKIQDISVDDFQKKAFGYAKRYSKNRSAREIFTCNTSANVEAFHAKEAIKTAEEFISTIRQIMIS